MANYFSTASEGTQTGRLSPSLKFVVHSEGLENCAQTKLLCVPRSISLSALRRRLGELLEEHSPRSLRYLLPGEPTSSPALVSVASDDDLALLVEEYDSLAAVPGGTASSRLHLYCSSSGNASPMSASPPSPRSVLRGWRGVAGGENGPLGALQPAAAPPASLRRKASHSPLPRPPPQPPQPQPPSASASMLLLAEAVVNSVLDDAEECGRGARRQIWTPPTPGREAAPPPPPPPFSSVPRIASDDMELGPRLGDGSYAVVHQGWWRGAAVAVKILRLAPSGADGAAAAQRAALAFAREAELLSRLQHPNVLSLYGCVAPAAPGVPPAAVLELMPHGALSACLRGRAAPPPLRLQARLALGAARAMQHLHAQSPPIIHFDLKADNLLVDWRDAQQPICKLADLGLAVAAGAALRRPGAAAGRGTLWWMAPELFPGAPAPAPVGTAVDVFSFGMVMWEVATGGAEPYPAGTPAEAVMDAVLRGARPALPPGAQLDARWGALMEACWVTEAAARPSFCAIVRALSALAA